MLSNISFSLPLLLWIIPAEFAYSLNQTQLICVFLLFLMCAFFINNVIDSIIFLWSMKNILNWQIESKSILAIIVVV